jgi:protein O-mannosyl-transferase
MSRQQFSGDFMRQKTYIVLALLAATFLVYWQCASHQFIILDDQLYVTQNPAIQKGLSADGIRWAFSAASTQTSGNWHPVTWLSHMADISLFGLNPAGHHLVNVALHAVNAALLFLVLCSLSGALWCSAVVAALFALHPLHVESVAWIAERKDVLSTFFWMLTLLCYAWYLKRPGALRYLATLCAFLVGLMAKPMLVTLPLIMLCLDCWPLGRLTKRAGEGEGAEDGWKTARRIVLEKVPFFLVTLVFCEVAIYAQRQGGYVPSLAEYPLKLRLSNALLAYREYLVNAFWPSDLAVYYPFPVLTSAWPVIGSFVLLAGITLFALLSLRRYPYLALGWFWFLITLVPVIGIIQVGHQSMADRYMYIPLIGLSIAVVWGVAGLFPALARRKAILAAATLAVLALLALGSYRQLGYWRDSDTLLSRTVSVTKDNYFAHFLLGNARFQGGNYLQALPEYQAAIRINPAYEAAHYKIGMISMITGDLDGAIRHLSISLKLDPSSERADNARSSLERCLAIRGGGGS